MGTVASDWAKIKKEVADLQQQLLDFDAANLKFSEQAKTDAQTIGDLRAQIEQLKGNPGTMPVTPTLDADDIAALADMDAAAAAIPAA